MLDLENSSRVHMRGNKVLELDYLCEADASLAKTLGSREDA